MNPNNQRLTLPLPTQPPRPLWMQLLPWIVAWTCVAVVFSAWPQLDLATTRLFWSESEGFSGNHYAALGVIHWLIIELSKAIALFCIVWIGAATALPGLCRFATRGAIFFVLLTLLLGPGGLGKATKDNWGRARPNAVQEFGGDKIFTPALVKTDQCERNCSFFSGHASFAFWFGALGLAFGRRRLAWGLALGVGIPVGLMRIAQGGHFLSDVMFAGLFVITLNALLFYWLRVPLQLERDDNRDEASDDKI